MIRSLGLLGDAVSLMYDFEPTCIICTVKSANSSLTKGLDGVGRRTLHFLSSNFLNVSTTCLWSSSSNLYSTKYSVRAT